MERDVIPNGNLARCSTRTEALEAISALIASKAVARRGNQASPDEAVADDYRMREFAIPTMGGKIITAWPRTLGAEAEHTLVAYYGEFRLPTRPPADLKLVAA